MKTIQQAFLARLEETLRPSGHQFVVQETAENRGTVYLMDDRMCTHLVIRFQLGQFHFRLVFARPGEGQRSDAFSVSGRLDEAGNIFSKIEDVASSNFKAA